jgi:hypothetical protein
MKEPEYTEGPEKGTLSESQKFDVVMRTILSVSKDELKNREKECRRKRERASVRS